MSHRKYGEHLTRWYCACIIFPDVCTTYRGAKPRLPIEPEREQKMLRLGRLSDGEIAWRLLSCHSAGSKAACAWWHMPVGSERFADAVLRLAGTMQVDDEKLYRLLTALVERDMETATSIPESFRHEVSLYLVDQFLLHTNTSIYSLKRKIGNEAVVTGLDRYELTEFIKRRMTEVLNEHLSFTKRLRRVLRELAEKNKQGSEMSIH